MNAESSPNRPMQYPDPSQAEQWGRAAAAVARAKANLGKQPKIINGAGVDRQAGQIIEGAPVADIPSSPGEFPGISTRDIRSGHIQVVDSHLDARRIPRHPEESAPAWAIDPTGEQHVVEAPNTTDVQSKADVPPSEDPWRGAPTGEAELLSPEDITTGRGPKTNSSSARADSGSSPWTGRRGEFSIIQRPSGYTGKRRR